MGFTHTKPFIKQNSCQRRSLISFRLQEVSDNIKSLFNWALGTKT